MQLVQALVRRSWIVVLIAVIASAAFAARATAALVEATYLLPTETTDRRLSVAPMVVPTHVEPDGGQLVARNMFCSICGSEPGGGDFIPNVDLIAISVGAEPRATLRVAGTVQSNLGVGDMIRGVGKLTQIQRQSIEVEDPEHRRAFVTVFHCTLPPIQPAELPFADQIHKIDNVTYEVDRALVRDLVSGSMKPGSLRILPKTEGGKLTGLELSGMRDGAVPAALGLKNGDTLSLVNNARLDSVNTLLELYAKLDQLKVIELEGTRAGRPLAITLRLR